jgi:DNA-binding HxlR family transcriptional regulator
MALGVDYARQDCSLARTLEVVGERWTMLILRDCFLGVRRFSDFAAHLDISRAVLTQRLAGLVEAGLLERTGTGHAEYVVTERARGLWPALFALAQWGDAELAPRGPRRLFEHEACGTRVDRTGRCPACGTLPGPEDLLTRPGPGADPSVRDDQVSLALRTPHRLLEPVDVRGPQRPE